MNLVYSLLTVNLIIMTAICIVVALEGCRAMRERSRQRRRAKTVLEPIAALLSPKAYKRCLTLLSMASEISAREAFYTLMAHFKREADRLKLDSSWSVDERLTSEQIQRLSMISIMGNLLQNALEALQTTTLSGTGVLRVLLLVEDSELHLEVFNSVSETERLNADLEQWRQVGFSTKASDSRGHGLNLVNRLVKAQDGILFLDNSEGVKFIVEFDL